MKKVFLFLSLILLVLVSCKKDKPDPVAELQQQMLGKWIYDKYVFENFDAGDNSTGAPTVYDYDDAIAYIEFKVDGTQVMTTNSQDFNNDTWEVVDASHFKIGQYTQAVVSISASVFVYKEEIIQPDGSKSVYTYTLKK